MWFMLFALLFATCAASFAAPLVMTTPDSNAWRAQRELLYQRFADSGMNPENKLLLFGENLFEQRAMRTSEIGQALLPSNYQLGPGDVLGLYLLGAAQREFELRVLPEGKVYVPTAGLLAVAGLTLTEAEKFLRERLARYFDTRELALTLLTTKVILVEVTGEVKRPGRYTLNGCNTILDALQLAGGATPLGSLRNLRVQHVNGGERLVDLYPTLLQPEMPAPLLLQAGDRIFVPPGQYWVALAGEVQRPAIYELRNTPAENLQNLLAFAGGATAWADTNEIEWSRFSLDGRREVIERKLSFSNADSATTRLRHGDRITFYSKLQNTHPRKVAIYGEVRSPGVFPFEENLRVRDLIQQAGGLTRTAYLLSAELARIEPNQPPRLEKIALQGILRAQNGAADSSTNLLLEEDDQLFIRKIPEWELGPLVEIRGEVKFPGSYPIAWGATHVSDLMRAAGGPTTEAALREARLYRHRSNAAEAQRKTEPIETLSRAELDVLRLQRNAAEGNNVSVDFHKLLVENDTKHDVLLEPGDVIDVPRQLDLIYVTGAVGLPGGVTYNASYRIDDYIAKAGGKGLHAARRQTKVIRASGEIVDDEDAGKLEAGDTIWVPLKGERSRWEALRDVITVAAQVATIYVVIDRATGN